MVDSVAELDQVEEILTGRLITVGYQLPGIPPVIRDHRVERVRSLGISRAGELHANILDDNKQSRTFTLASVVSVR